MEGLSELITNSGVVNLYLPCNDNAVLTGASFVTATSKQKKKAAKYDRDG